MAQLLALLSWRGLSPVGKDGRRTKRVKKLLNHPHSLYKLASARIGVEGVAASDGSPQLVIRTFGNTPALNVFIESNCYITDFSGTYTGSPPVVKPEGEILSPGMPYKLECDRATNKAPTRANADFHYLKGTVNYKDIFRQSHTTNFCFFRGERPGEHLHVCDTGNSLD